MRKRVRQHTPAFHLVPDGLDVTAELFVREPVGKKSRPFQNGQSRPNQSDELLIEDQELFKIYTLAARLATA